MRLGQYQTEAAVTICVTDKKDMTAHAVLGMVSEMGEFLNALCFGDEEHIKKEMGDVCWMIAELCTASGWKLNEVVSLSTSKQAEANPSCLDEICGIFQKTYQGHEVNVERVQECLRQIWQALMNTCEMKDWKMQDILDLNIAKLRKRYPNGFSVENSLHRAEGDV